MEINYKEVYSQKTADKIEELVAESYCLEDLVEFIEANSEEDFCNLYEEYVNVGEQYSYGAADAFIEEFGLQSFSDSFDIEGNLMNGYLMAYIILQLLLVHVPLLIALVAGDMFSGEAAQGTLRVILTKPLSRAKLILAKFTATSIYTIALRSEERRVGKE